VEVLQFGFSVVINDSRIPCCIHTGVTQTVHRKYGWTGIV